MKKSWSFLGHPIYTVAKALAEIKGQKPLERETQANQFGIDGFGNVRTVGYRKFGFVDLGYAKVVYESVLRLDPRTEFISDLEKFYGDLVKHEDEIKKRLRFKSDFEYAKKDVLEMIKV